ncbi:DHA2 family efflux MFS transporter permease subunit [Nakamurella silvestris]|nr:DHA2 family efflux MFS transporter permease subunit [Nakamurella silvestris]
MTSQPPGTTPTNTHPAPSSTDSRPWPALWALCIGFFMILVDSTIVSVATPAIMKGLDAGINEVVWVTSAYLLAYAVPLLVTGRLGDMIGPKKVYMAGLTVFTVASLLCGLSGSVGMLIAARVLQGFGAAMMTPQTMAVITRTFAPDKRGVAMSLWGAVAGVATLVGPILGGVLVDSFGWEWIFIVNVPVGVIALGLAWKLVPRLKTQPHRYDLLGITLSTAGLFCLVFGIQEGQTYDWGTIVGPISVWSLIILGLVLLAAFVYWQSKNRQEPLMPLKLFTDRNFSLANIGIWTVGFAITGMALPLMLFAQNVLGLSPTRAALVLAPMAIFTGVLAPVTGKLVDHRHPRYLAGFGLGSLIVSLVWLWAVMAPGVAIWELLLPISLMGVANAFIWSPLSVTATRNLPVTQAGAGAGFYNTSRQIGAVLGSAGIGVLMQSRLSANLPAGAGAGPEAAPTGALPEALHAGYASAMGQAMLLPAAVLLIGLAAALAFRRPPARTRAAAPAASLAGTGVGQTVGQSSDR